MSDDVRVFLAMIATCPAIALFIVIMAAMDGSTIEDAREGFGIWALLSAGLILLVSAACGLYAVWTWAV
jgi:hypothetical protein